MSELLFDKPQIQDTTYEEAIELVKRVKWFHTIDLQNGIITPGIKRLGPDHDAMLKLLPANMKGLTVLDVGTADGFFAFECERRGARVWAIDSNQRWNGFGHSEPNDSFKIARRILKSNVKFANIDLFSLNPEMIEKFDFVLLFGVIYHTPAPLVALKRAKDLCKYEVLIETHSAPGWQSKAVFYMHGYNGDESTRWAPTKSCLSGMMENIGLEVLSIKNIGGRLVARGLVNAHYEPEWWPEGL